MRYKLWTIEVKPDVSGATYEARISRLGMRIFIDDGYQTTDDAYAGARIWIDADAKRNGDQIFVFFMVAMAWVVLMMIGSTLYRVVLEVLAGS